MVKVLFTSHLRHVAPNCSVEVTGRTVGAALNNVWRRHPQVRSYVLDDQGRVRRHIAIFLNGQRLRTPLRRRIEPDVTIHVMQALSGG